MNLGVKVVLVWIQPDSLMGSQWSMVHGRRGEVVREVGAILRVLGVLLVRPHWQALEGFCIVNLWSYNLALKYNSYSTCEQTQVTKTKTRIMEQREQSQELVMP